MRYLITGGSGFIGGHLTESLIAEGHQVVVIDDLSTGSPDNLKSVEKHPALEFIEADILEFEGLEKAVAGVDAVFHLAAAVGVELVVHDPVRTIETNVHGTEAILKAASKFNKKILITSTSEVYGKSQKELFSETDDLLIGPPTHSRWSYACSKLLDEFFIMAYYRDRGLPGIIVRLFNTVGPRQTGRYGMVLPRFTVAALKNEPLQVYGTGEQTRCFCHVLDTVEALKALIKTEDAVGRTLNIGGSESISIKSLAEKVKSRTGSESDIVLVPYDQAYEKGFEDMLHRIPDTKTIRELTGWKPGKDLDSIIDDVAEFIKNSGKA
jgi:UDP-glucose 4-epimerase